MVEGLTGVVDPAPAAGREALTRPVPPAADSERGCTVLAVWRWLCGAGCAALVFPAGLFIAPVFRWITGLC